MMEMHPVVSLKQKSPQQACPPNPSPPLRGSSMARNAQCTHMTMTRIYNHEFRCGMCLRPGELGWLYRCTQDRELIIEDEIRRGCPTTIIDKIPLLLSLQDGPKKRSPVARTMSEISVFDEIDDQRLKTYSPQQIEIILKQRAHVLECVKQFEPFRDFGNGLQILALPSQPSPSALPVSSQPSGFKNLQLKPWIQGIECQFKVCHRCRYHSSERAFLSLDGIANGDYPPTAIVGFGFHFQGQRPVSLVRHVRKLGLRTNPPTSPNSKVFLNAQQSPKIPELSPSVLARSPLQSGEPPSPFNDEQNADTTFGQQSNAYDSASMTRKLSAEADSSSNAKRIPHTNVPSLQEVSPMGISSIDDSLKKVGKQVNSATSVKPPWTLHINPSSKTVTGEEIEVCEQSGEVLYGSSDQSLETKVSLKHFFNLENHVRHGGDVGLFSSLNSKLLCHAPAVPFPPVKPGEPLGDLQQLTSIETAELEGPFSGVPPKFSKGIEVTEEGVAQHCETLLLPSDHCY